MKINIPCPYCGCQVCEGQTQDGVKCEISICRCADGSNEFDVTIEYPELQNTDYEKHQCTEEELETCLQSRFNIDLESINHQCS